MAGRTSFNYDAISRAVDEVKGRRAPSKGGRGRVTAAESRAWLKSNSAKKKKKKKKDDDGGFLDGLAKNDFVMGALELVDTPRSVIMSSVADIAEAAGTAAGGGGYGDLVESVGNTLNPIQLARKAGVVAGEAVGLGDVVGGADDLYAKKKYGKDALKHTGTGTYLERGIKDAGLQGTWVDNQWVKRGVGFAGDVALDPLSYTGAGAVAKGGTKAVANRVLREGAENAAQKLAKEAGVSLADKYAAKAIREEAKRLAEEGAAKVIKGKGASALSPYEMELLLGGKGGLKIRAPGAGRVGRAASGKKYGATAKELTIVPKSLTDLITSAGRAVKKGITENKVSRALGNKLGGSDNLLRDAARTGDTKKITDALKLGTIKTTANARKEAGLRLMPDAVIGGETHTKSATGARAMDVYTKHIRKLVEDDPEGIIRAIETGDTVGVQGADVVKDFLRELKRSAEANGVKISERENYFPRWLTDEAKAARSGKGFGGASGKATFEGQRANEAIAKAAGLDPSAVTEEWTIRSAVEGWAKKELPNLPEGYYEKNINKLLPHYVEAMGDRIATQEIVDRAVDAGIVVPAWVQKTATLNRKQIKAAEKALRAAEKAQTKGDDAGAAADEANALEELSNILSEDARQAAEASAGEVSQAELARLGGTEGMAVRGAAVDDIDWNDPNAVEAALERQAAEEARVEAADEAAVVDSPMAPGAAALPPEVLAAAREAVNAPAAKQRVAMEKFNRVLDELGISADDAMDQLAEANTLADEAIEVGGTAARGADDLFGRISELRAASPDNNAFSMMSEEEIQGMRQSLADAFDRTVEQGGVKARAGRHSNAANARKAGEKLQRQMDRLDHQNVRGLAADKSAAVSERLKPEYRAAADDFDRMVHPDDVASPAETKVAMDAIRELAQTGSPELAANRQGGLLMDVINARRAAAKVPSGGKKAASGIPEFAVGNPIFHGTSGENAVGIFDEGLRPGATGDAFASTDPAEAWAYAVQGPSLGEVGAAQEPIMLRTVADFHTTKADGTDSIVKSPTGWRDVQVVTNPHDVVDGGAEPILQSLDDFIRQNPERAKQLDDLLTEQTDRLANADPNVRQLNADAAAGFHVPDPIAGLSAPAADAGVVRDTLKTRQLAVEAAIESGALEGRAALQAVANLAADVEAAVSRIAENIRPLKHASAYSGEVVVAPTTRAAKEAASDNVLGALYRSQRTPAAQNAADNATDVASTFSREAADDARYIADAEAGIAGGGGQIPPPTGPPSGLGPPTPPAEPPIGGSGPNLPPQRQVAGAATSLEADKVGFEVGMADAQAKLARFKQNGWDTTWVEKRVAIYEQGLQTSDEYSRRALQFQADALDAAEQADQLLTKAAVNRTTAQRLSEPATINKLRDEIGRSMARLRVDDSLAAPNEVADIINRVSKVATSEGARKFLNHYDKALNFIKAWQIATPGFHVRNFMGGMFNNYLADVELGSYRQFVLDRAKYNAGTLTGERAAYMEQLLPHVGSAQYSAYEVGGLETRTGLARANPLSSSFEWLTQHRKAGAGVEGILRGALGYDRLLKGQTLDEAVADIVKYHFDYQDLSNFERGTVKRVIPFYTWTRHNLPLQMEQYLAQPGKYARYWQAKQEIEMGQDPEGVVPEYFLHEGFGIQSPFKFGGNASYITPDLPFTNTVRSALPDLSGVDISKPGTYASALDGYASMVTPIIKTPVERIMNKQYFKGIPFQDKMEDVPTGWKHIPGLTTALGVAGIIDGKGQISDRDKYTLQAYVPVLGTIRRLAGGSEKDNARQMTSWLSYLGIPLKTNTPYEQQMEKYRRKYEGKQSGNPYKQLRDERMNRYG